MANATLVSYSGRPVRVSDVGMAGRRRGPTTTGFVDTATTSAFAAITVALRKSLGEITVQDLHARDDPGYDGLCEGHDLYEAAWFSAHLVRKMYLKFSLFDGRLIIVSFHESTNLDS